MVKSYAAGLVAVVNLVVSAMQPHCRCRRVGWPRSGRGQQHIQLRRHRLQRQALHRAKVRPRASRRHSTCCVWMLCMHDVQWVVLYACCAMNTCVTVLMRYRCARPPPGQQDSTRHKSRPTRQHSRLASCKENPWTPSLMQAGASMSRRPDVYRICTNDGSDHSPQGTFTSS